jgi:peptidoglycan/LPS O-acetylase OafA/YrhL
MSDTHRTHYRPDIDGLRAVAVLLVLGYHAAPGLVPGGFIGVDIFFVISGYLIAGLIWTDIDLGKFSLLMFYARRCRRIIPALAVVLAATWAIGWNMLFADEFENLGQHVVGGALFAANLVLARETGYFNVAADTKPLLHLWSLGIEGQFYLLWPAIALVVFRRRYPMGVVLALLGTVSLALYILVWQSYPSLTFYLLPTRFWEILAGAALAYYGRSHPAPAGRNVHAYVGLTAIFMVAFGFDLGVVHPRFWPVIAVASALLLIYSGERASICTKLLASRSAVFVGLISYPLYLWHWPLLTFARISEGENLDLGLIMAVLATSFVLAWLTWRLVERPLRNRVFPLEREPRLLTRCLACGVAAIGILASVGVVTYAREGFASRNADFFAGEPQPAETNFQWVQKYSRDEACLRTGEFDDSEFCRRSDGQLQVAVVGDSHANHLMPGLINAFSRQGVGVIHVGNGGCPSILDVQVISPKGRKTCGAATWNYIKFLISTPSIRTVMLVSRISLYLDAANGYRLNAKGRSSFPQETGNLATLLDGYSDLISRLESAGKTVVVLSELPQLAFDPRDCVAVRPMRINPHAIRRPCTQIPDKQQFALVQPFLSALKARHPDLTVIEPRSLLCAQGECPVMLDRRLLYRDRDHLSLAGSNYLAQPLAARLEATLR